MEGRERPNVEDLMSENRVLYEELTQCKADKDFVWNLWKKLQSSQPDLGSVVSMVMAREKEKCEVKDRKILEILKMKDEKIKELKEAALASGEEAQYNQTRYHDLLIANEELKQRLVDRESEFSRKEAETKEENEYLSEIVKARQIQKETHDDKVKEILDTMEEEKNDLKAQIANLETQLNKLGEERESLAAVMETNADMDKRIKGLAREMEGLTEMCSQLRKQHEEAVLNLRLKECKIQEQESSLQQQSRDLKLNESTIAALREQLKLNESNIAVLREQLKLNESNIATLREQLKLNESTIAALREQLRQAEVATNNTSQQSSEQEKMILQLEATKSKQERSFIARHAEHSRGVETLQKLVTDLQAQCSWNQAVETQLRLEMDELKTSSAGQLMVKEEVIRELKEAVVGIHSGVSQDNRTTVLPKKGKYVAREGDSREYSRGTRLVERMSGRDDVGEDHEDTRTSPTHGPSTERTGKAPVIRTTPGHPEAEVMSMKLGRCESRVEELKKLLELKESELVETRRAHSQRQQRYRMLKENYQFVQEQLRTYETEAEMGFTKQLPARPDERELRHEDSDQIWKELAHYKAEYETLAKERHDILEEIDVIRVQHAGSVATMQELQVHFQEERAQNERLLSDISQGREQIKALELDIDKMENDLASWQDQALKGQRMVQEIEEEKQLLELERGAFLKENKALRSELSQLADEFEELKSEQHLQRLKQQQQQRDTRLANLDESHTDDGLIADSQAERYRVQRQVETISKYEEQVRRVADKIMESSAGEVNKPSLPRQASLGTQTEEISRTADFSVNVNMDGLGDVSDDGVNLGGESGTRAKSRQGRVAGFKKPTAALTPLTKKAQGLKRTPGRNEWASMKQRILGLTQEVSALRQAKDKAVKELNQQKEANESLQAQFNVVLQKVQVSRSSVQHLTDSLKQCQKEKDSFAVQLTVRSEERVGAVSVADWKHLEEQLTAASRECVKLSHIVRSLTTENDDLKARLKEAQLKISRMEHALNQKRVLVEEMKGKVKGALDKGAKSDEQITSLEEKVAQMKERDKANKVRIGTLERRQQTEAKEKSKYHQKLLRCEEEVRKKTHLLSKTQALRCQAEVVVSEMEAVAAIQLQGLANQSEAVMTSLRYKLDKVTERVEEFQAFVKTLLEDMLNSTRRGRESLTVHQEKQWRNTSKSSVQRAQQKARDILDISSSDLEEILHEDDALQWSLWDKAQWRRLEAALQRENAFAVPLLELLLDAIEERVSVESKLRALSET